MLSIKFFWAGSIWNGLAAYHKSDERIGKMEHEAHLSAIEHGYADK